MTEVKLTVEADEASESATEDNVPRESASVPEELASDECVVLTCGDPVA